MQSERSAVSLTQILATLQLRHEEKRQTVVRLRLIFLSWQDSA